MTMKRRTVVVSGVLRPKPFAQIARDPKSWVETANSLIWSARALQITVGTRGVNKVPPHHGVFLMLYGFGLENLFKGLLIAKGVDPISDNRLSKVIRGHDLRSMAERCCLPLRSAQVKLLERLERDIVHTGRYPVPLSPPKVSNNVRWSSTDTDMLEELINDLQQRIKEALLLVPGDK